MNQTEGGRLSVSLGRTFLFIEYDHVSLHRTLIQRMYMPSDIYVLVIVYLAFCFSLAHTHCSTQTLLSNA